ncbi:MAG: YlxR family protein [Bacilli bacterium]|nr:YlxR family protein [Bacilli bacterium]
MAKRKRKIPLRTCVVTNEMRPKQEMIRVVRNKEGEIFVDETGKQNGRGAYLTIDKEVFRQAREKKILDKVFQTEVDESVYDELDRLVSD